MAFLYNFNQEFKPLFFTALLHLTIFASLFSFAPVSFDVSNYQSSGSFTITSFSEQEEGVSENKIIKQEKNIVKNSANISQNILPNQQNNEANSSSEVIYDAKNLGNPQPEYPALSKSRGEEGVVLICAFVDASGVASKVEVFKSSSFALLDESALDAVKEWRFVPAKKLGQYIASSVIIPINFKLTQNL